MQAVKYIGHGGPDVIEYGSVPDPEPGASEVLVDVKAGALNHLDIWTRGGLPGLDLEMPHIIDYGTEEIPEAVRAATDKRGVDVVVDHVGGETWGNSLRALARGGRLVTCGATAGPNPRTDIPRIFGNQLAILGSTMATPGEVDDVLAKVWDGTYEVRIRETLPMSETAQAHELLEDREGFGKVVVVPDSER